MLKEYLTKQMKDPEFAKEYLSLEQWEQDIHQIISQHVPNKTIVTENTNSLGMDMSSLKASISTNPDQFQLNHSIGTDLDRTQLDISVSTKQDKTGLERTEGKQKDQTGLDEIEKDNQL